MSHELNASSKSSFLSRSYGGGQMEGVPWMGSYSEGPMAGFELLVAIRIDRVKLHRVRTHACVEGLLRGPALGVVLGRRLPPQQGEVGVDDAAQPGPSPRGVGAPRIYHARGGGHDG